MSRRRWIVVALVLTSCERAGDRHLIEKPRPAPEPPTTPPAETDEELVARMLSYVPPWLDELAAGVDYLDDDLGCDGVDRACEAARAAQERCRRGEAKGCGRLAEAYWVGNGLPARDLDRGLEVAALACKLGEAWGCVQFANAIELSTTRKHPYRPDIAFAMHHHHCFQRDDVPWACFAVARSTEVFWPEQDPVWAMRALERGCELEGPGGFLCAQRDCKREQPDRRLMDCPPWP